MSPAYITPTLLADMTGEPQVMGDEQQRRAMQRLLFGDQPHDMRLRHHVERGGRLVGDHQRGFARKCHRDQHALALPARQFMRIAKQRLFGIAKLHLLQPLDHQCAPATLLNAEMPQMLAELAADGAHRIERA